MLPISRLAPKRASAVPLLSCSALSSPSLGRCPVTPVSKPQCRHKASVRTNPANVVTGSRTVKAAPTVRAPIPTEKPGAPEAQVFTQADVPGVEFLRSQLATLGPPDLTLEQCLEAIKLYCDGAPKRDLAWAKRLINGKPAHPPFPSSNPTDLYPSKKPT